MANHIWTTLTRISPDGTRGDRDFDKDIDKRNVVAARDFLNGPKSARNALGTEVSTDRPYYQERVDGITGQWEETAEGIQEAPPFTPINVADMKVRVKYYTAALVLSKNRFEDEKFGLIQNLVPKILERGLERIEIDFQNKFINTATTFDATRDLRDGVALASTLHPAGLNGAVYGNTLAVPSALSESTLATAITSFMGVRDDNGDVAPMLGTKFQLFVHPSRILFAQQLCKSLSSTADYKNSGVISQVAASNGFQWEIIPMFYQQNVNAWGIVMVTSDGTGLNVVMRRAPSNPKKIVRENPEQLQYFSEMRYAMYAADPRKYFFSGLF